MTTNKEELIYLSILPPKEAIKIFNEIFKNHNINRVSKTDTEYRDNEIRDFLSSHEFVLKVKKLEGEKKIPYKYQREVDGRLVVYSNIKNKKIIDENENLFNTIYLNFNENIDKEAVKTIAGKQDKDNLEDFEEDDEKNNDNSIPIEQADDENNQEEKRKAIETEVREKKAAKEKRIVELDNLKGLQEMTPVPEEKDKPQQQTKIQKFSQYKKVTRQNLTDNPKKAQVKGNTDTQITKEKDKPIKTLVKEKTEKQVTSEVKHGMFNHEKKQEAAFQKYAQGKNHMTRFNTNMAEALKIRINQGFSPFSH
jgi:hypothetical protein